MQNCCLFCCNLGPQLEKQRCNAFLFSEREVVKKNAYEKMKFFYPILPCASHFVTFQPKHRARISLHHHVRKLRKRCPIFGNQTATLVLQLAQSTWSLVSLISSTKSGLLSKLPTTRLLSSTSKAGPSPNPSCLNVNE